MKKYYLAIDIGASGGRHILGHLENGLLKTEEVYRFPNSAIPKNGQLCWDVFALFQEILIGLRLCKTLDKIPETIGIDTWAVDFVLLDADRNPIGDCVCYRDGRTEGMDTLVDGCISSQELYERTGIQKQRFNSIYQLMALKTKEPAALNKAESMLMLPDYFHFLLTGEMKSEYTNATTTQLVHQETKNWDWDLIDRLGFSRKLFQPIVPAGTRLGQLSTDVAARIGYTSTVMLPPTHDTASAVVAVPFTSEPSIFLSSGTWSLMGLEQAFAVCDKNSHDANLTNEGGFQYRFRYLKNIMGLWLAQSLQKEQGHSYEQLCSMAETSHCPAVINCGDPAFFAPTSMKEAIQNHCRQTGQEIPQTDADLAHVVYHSLACCYKDTVNLLEALTQKTYKTIHIVGGGTKADYLNQLTAKATDKQILAGPIEATAIGNIAVQMIQAGEFSGLDAARRCIFTSFPPKKF